MTLGGIFILSLIYWKDLKQFLEAGFYGMKWAKRVSNTGRVCWGDGFSYYVVFVMFGMVICNALCNILQRQTQVY